VFQYITFRGAYAALTTLVLCYICGPILIRKLTQFKVGQSVRSDGPQTHLAKSGTPTMGGILIILSVFVSMLLWMDMRNWKVWLILASFLAFGGIGFLDDYLKIKGHSSDGLAARGKLVFQFAFAIVIVLILYIFRDEQTTQLYIPFFKNAVVDMGAWWIPFAVLLIVGESNAVNLSDGLDGLASGLLLMVFITLGIFTYLSERIDFASYLGIPYIGDAGEITIFCLAVVGACVGFLWFNCHPAEVFMGDVGSLALGAAVATVSLVIKKEIIVLVVGGVFVLEAA
jgi:phospho-N-acetylmuramoyl-pentapeptide-transferase